MEFTIESVSKNASNYDVKRAFAEVLHSEDFYNPASQKGRPMNMDVWLKESSVLGFRHAGEGKLTLPTRQDGERFLRWLRSGNQVVVDGRKLFIRKAFTKAMPRLTETLKKVPFIDPVIEQEREQKIAQLSKSIQVSNTQFGVYYTLPNQTARAYSIEWDHDCRNNDVAFLSVRFEHKSVRIDVRSREHLRFCYTYAD
jgi:RNA-dependent RNA polymerase